MEMETELQTSKGKLEVSEMKPSGVHYTDPDYQDFIENVHEKAPIIHVQLTDYDPCDLSDDVHIDVYYQESRLLELHFQDAKYEDMCKKLPDYSNFLRHFPHYTLQDDRKYFYQLQKMVTRDAMETRMRLTGKSSMDIFLCSKSLRVNPLIIIPQNTRSKRRIFY